MIRPWLHVPDMHFPFEDKRFWKLLLKVGMWLKPYGIIIYGDFLDFFAISAHSKNPARWASVECELEAGKVARAELDSLKAKSKYYLKGNHEYRWERYMWDHCPPLWKQIPSVESLLEMEEHGWEVIQYKKFGKVGHYRFTHDIGSAGQYAHFKAANAFQSSNGTGHTHRAGIHYFGTIEGENKVSAMFGWGGDKDAAEYANETQKKDWIHSFGVSYEDTTTGSHHIQVIPSINYSCVVNGKLFEAPFIKQTVKKKPIMSYDELLKRQQNGR